MVVTAMESAMGVELPAAMSTSVFTHLVRRMADEMRGPALRCARLDVLRA